MSNLQKNQELKNILLAETPWLTEATNEAEQKQRIATLFDLNTMNSQLAVSVEKLGELQNPMAHGVGIKYARQPLCNYSGNGNACPAECIDSSGC